MSFLISIGILLAVPIGLGVAMAVRGRRSGAVNQNQIDAGKADSLAPISRPDGFYPLW
ncbi:MAG: hypothetical protein ACTHJW_27535 [Streptosporangiaceae bacterium]